MKETDKPLSELAEDITLYPQVLKNVEVTNKEDVLKHPQIADTFSTTWTTSLTYCSQSSSDGASTMTRITGSVPVGRTRIRHSCPSWCSTFSIVLAICGCFKTSSLFVTSTFFRT